MNKRKKAWNTFFFWLFPGILTGVLLAIFLSMHQYKIMKQITGSVLQEQSLEAGLKLSVKNNPTEKILEHGHLFLQDYGYHPENLVWKKLPLSVGICILVFQMTGWISYGFWLREEQCRQKRIQDLTAYLKAVNAQNGGTLTRTEDQFSFLEDEIYKTTTELKHTKETAVKNHGVLEERIADIAHQLKTPLTSMSLMTELLEEYQTPETMEYYQRLSTQILRLQNLVSGLLALAKLDSHGIVLEKNPFRMQELLELAVEPLQQMLEQKQIALQIPAAAYQDPWLHGDLEWTSQAVMNVLKNCIEHSPKGGTLYVSWMQNPLYVQLEIEDSGSGFAKQDLPHLFERFYRGERSCKDNAGIGLALAKLIMEQQNGHILAENSVQGHALFIFKWYHPLQPQ